MKGKVFLMAFLIIGMIGLNAYSLSQNADFYWQPENPTDLDNIHFIDTSTGDKIAWIWYFGDGNTSTSQNPWHRYADDGIYDARLVVIFSDGNISTVTKQITVYNVPPHAVIAGKKVYNTSIVPLISASYDDDGNIASCHWEFGDGFAGNGCSIQHEYEKDGLYTVNLTVYDDDGASNTTNKTIMVDTLPPVTSYNSSCEDWCNVNVFVSLNASDNLSGVNYTKYKIDDGEWKIYNATIVISSEGIHKVYFYSVDNAGNREEEKNITVKIDKTKPDTEAEIKATYGKHGWIRGDAKIKLNASDNLSGVNYTEYKIDDGEWKIYNATIVISSEGTHKVYFYSVDNAGNREEEKNITVKIDKTKPDIHLEMPQQGYLYIANHQIIPTLFHKTIIIGKFTSEARASDDVSGIYYVEFVLNGKLLWKDFVSPYNAELPQEFPFSFSNRLKAIAYDEAGNYEESSEVIYIKIV